MRQLDSKLYVILGFVVSLILSASTLQAQDTQDGQQGNQGQDQYEQQYEQNQPKADDFSDSEIESFVSAREGVDELREEFQPKFQEADDVDKAQKLREDFQNKAIEVLDEEGLDVQTYNNIVKGMDSDDELREKVEQKMGQ
ncbi:MAG: DUF4168 domain-containing protein [Desulfovermiculus sp.]